MPRKKKIDGEMTIEELAFKLVGEKPRRVLASHVLRTLATLRFAIGKSGLSETEFALRFIETQAVRKGKAAPANLKNKWKNAKTTATEKKLILADRQLGGVLDFFRQKIFTLLENRVMGLKEIDTILREYTDTSIGTSLWKIPNSGDTWKQPGSGWYPVLSSRGNSEQLIHWRNIHGFTIILALVREAEAKRDTMAHMHHMSNLYRALPTVLTSPGFKENQELLFHCVEEIHGRHPLSRNLIRVDWVTIQVLATEEFQHRFSEPYGSLRHWGLIKDSIWDVVANVTPEPQELWPDYFDPLRTYELYNRALECRGKRAKTIYHDVPSWFNYDLVYGSNAKWPEDGDLSCSADGSE